MRRRSLLLGAALAGVMVADTKLTGANAQLPIPAGTPLTGRAAQDSPPARTFTLLLTAVAKGDFAVIRSALAQGHPGLGMLNPGGLPMIKAELLPHGAAPAAVMATLAAVYIEGDGATLVFGTEPGRTIWKMRRDTEGWKLSP